MGKRVRSDRHTTKYISTSRDQRDESMERKRARERERERERETDREADVMKDRERERGGGVEYV